MSELENVMRELIEKHGADAVIEAMPMGYNNRIGDYYIRKDNELLYVLTVDDITCRTGDRKLTDEQVESLRDGINAGLDDCADLTIREAIRELDRA